MFALIKNIPRILSLLLRTPKRSIYHALLRGVSPLPSIVLDEGPSGIYSGIRGDLTYEKTIKSGLNEPHFLEILNLCVEETDNVIDLGANIGSHSVAMSRKVSAGSVFSFEPQSLVFSILQNNLLLNKCSNVFPFRFAITDSDFQTMAMEAFSFSGDEFNNGSIRLDPTGSSLGDLVLTRTLDSLDLNNISFIKMDIQGAEISALRGSEQLIKASRPFMFVEVEEIHLKALGGSSEELMSLILGMGYVMYRINTDYPCDHLCVPLEKSDAFEEIQLNKLTFSTDRIFGTSVQLKFESPDSQTYSEINCIP